MVDLTAPARPRTERRAPRPGGDRWAPGRGRERVEAAADADRARRTIPLGRPEGDDAARPDVDLGLWTLHVRYQRRRDEPTLGLLVEEYHAYALSLARRFHREGIPLEDLQQVALEALVKALQRFDCERRLPFPGFATPTIVGALKRHYRDQGWALRVPRSVHALAGPAQVASTRLASELGRAPTDEELAEALDVEVDVVRLVRSAVDARRTRSLDAPTPDGDAPLEPGGLDRALQRAEDAAAVSGAVQVLDERDRQVLGLYFFEELTQSQIAERYGVSQMQVSRWLRSSLDRLRAHLDAG